MGPSFIALVLFALLALIVLLRWFVNTPAERITYLLRNSVWIALALSVFVLALSGRLHWLFVLGGALVGLLVPLVKTLFPLLLRYAPLLHGLLRRYRTSRSSQRYQQQASARQSQVETCYLRMTLDHDSGAMHGVVLTGAFEGRALESMSAEQLLKLLDECRDHDEESVVLLEAFLDRQYGEDWRQHADQCEREHGGASSGSSAMRVDEAYEILGLSPDASKAQITEAHRRLIQKLHPDRGGSTYLAIKINQAKALLMKEV